MVNKKNLIKLFALGSVLSIGCISKQPAYQRDTHIQQEKDGTCTTNEIINCVGCKTEFTELGTLWNTVSYGALGAPYGFISGAWQGYQEPENSSTTVKIANSVYSAVKGIGVGCYQGICYGYNLEYAKGRSVEGHVFDIIEDTTDLLYNMTKHTR